MPTIEMGNTWIIQVPAGTIFGKANAPLNYALFSNPWGTLQFESNYVSPPFDGMLEIDDMVVTIQNNHGDLRGIFKHAYWCTTRKYPGKDYVIKTLKQWHPRKKDREAVPERYYEEFEADIREMVEDYESQVLLSYLSFYYSNRKRFTEKGGVADQLQYPRGGKFAYSQPLLVKITDVMSGMWTLGLVENAFGEMKKDEDEWKFFSGTRTLNYRRAEDFVDWVNEMTSNPEWPTETLPIVDLQGFWFNSPSMFMTDGRFNTGSEDTKFRSTIRKAIFLLIRLFHRTGVANAKHSDLDNPSNSVKYARQWAVDLVNKANSGRPESPYFNLEELEKEDETKNRKRITQIAKFVQKLQAEKAKLVEEHEYLLWSRPSMDGEIDMSADAAFFIKKAEQILRREQGSKSPASEDSPKIERKQVERKKAGKSSKAESSKSAESPKPDKKDQDKPPVRIFEK